MKSIQKEKKITIKFFLNQLVEPVTGEKGQSYYPLYIQVTYNRKNMQFKSKYGLYYQDANEIEPALLQFEENTLRQIINYESGQTDAEYDLKGLKRKYEVYSTSVLDAVEQFLKPKLKSAILKTNDELTTVLDFNQSKATVGRLFKAARLLFPKFEQSLTIKLREELAAYDQFRQLFKEPILSEYIFPTIISWIISTYPNELEAKLKVIYKGKPEASKKVMTLIQQAVTEKLKQLGS
jgi:hypothetical protein